jgi:hypothetical protein
VPGVRLCRRSGEITHLYLANAFLASEGNPRFGYIDNFCEISVTQYPRGYNVTSLNKAKPRETLGLQKRFREGDNYSGSSGSSLNLMMLRWGLLRFKVAM